MEGSLWISAVARLGASGAGAHGHDDELGREHGARSRSSAENRRRSLLWRNCRGLIRQDPHDLPRRQRRKLSVRRWEITRWLPLRRSTPSPSPANCRRQRCRVLSPTPRSAARVWTLAPAARPASRISRALWRSSGEVNPPRPLPSRPGSFLRRSTMLLPPPEPCPSGAVPAAAV